MNCGHQWWAAAIQRGLPSLGGRPMTADPLAQILADIANAVWQGEPLARAHMFTDEAAELRERVPGIDHLIAGDDEQLLTERGWARIHLDESLFIDRVVWVAPAAKETP